MSLILIWHLDNSFNVHSYKNKNVREDDLHEVKNMKHAYIEHFLYLQNK